MPSPSDYLIALLPSSRWPPSEHGPGTFLWAVDRDAFAEQGENADDPSMDELTQACPLFPSTWHPVFTGLFHAPLDLAPATEWVLKAGFVLSGPWQDAVEARWSLGSVS